MSPPAEARAARSLLPALSPTGAEADPAAGLRPHEQAGRSALLQLVQLRWLAVAGQLAAIAVVHGGLGVRLPLRALLAFVLGLALFNIASWVRARSARDVGDGELMIGLLVDLLVLTMLLALTGGINNPFLFIYLPQVAIGALLLERALAWALVAAATGAIFLLSQWHLPLRWPGAPVQPLAVEYVGGLLLCFALSASLVVVVILRIGQTLRQRDARLAALRQRAAEEEHIVRMGLLASGAAHELSTPLATLSVILGDWSHMGPISAEPELREDVEQMQAQVQRCKAIISGILMSAGDARADATETTTLAAFLQATCADWSRRRGVGPLQPELGPTPDDPIFADAGLRQMVINLLDNALEAAPHQLPRLLAESDDERLQLRVLDQGPGFAPEILEHFGRPYHSTKGKPGGGLGVFLSVNVARGLGGNVIGRNRPTAGAEVLVELPLAALRLPDEALDDPADEPDPEDDDATTTPSAAPGRRR
ncbi:MAG: histidine kinase [Pseudomonadota bacterium]|jgi:two-component system sensor histidine kinase RegB